uniref:Uncharacterized protein n=2 Tax=Sarcoptes scabiei TaxID=52283 RepID=A0A834RBU1_SARSC
MMMNQIANKAWKVIKPHVPLIQFKKGDRLSQAGSQRSHLDGQNTVKIADDIDLPLKYRRKPMTELEMQMIETGGVPL